MQKNRCQCEIENNMPLTKDESINVLKKRNCGHDPVIGNHGFIMCSQCLNDILVLLNKPESKLTVERVKGMIKLEIENHECHIRSYLGHAPYGEERKRNHKIEALKELLATIEINEAEDDRL